MMYYNWRKGMLTRDWFDVLMAAEWGGLLSFVCPNTSFTVGLPE